MKWMVLKPMTELLASCSKPCDKGGTLTHFSQAPSHSSCNWMSIFCSLFSQYHHDNSDCSLFGWCSACILMVINNEVLPWWVNRLDPCVTLWSTRTMSRSVAVRSLLLFLLPGPAVSFLLTRKLAFDDSIIYIFNYIACTGYLLWGQVASCLGASVSAVLLINWW